MPTHYTTQVHRQPLSFDRRPSVQTTTYDAYALLDSERQLYVYRDAALLEGQRARLQQLMALPVEPALYLPVEWVLDRDVPVGVLWPGAVPPALTKVWATLDDEQRWSSLAQALSTVEVLRRACPAALETLDVHQWRRMPRGRICWAWTLPCGTAEKPTTYGELLEPLLSEGLLASADLRDVLSGDPQRDSAWPVLAALLVAAPAPLATAALEQLHRRCAVAWTEKRLPIPPGYLDEVGGLLSAYRAEQAGPWAAPLPEAPHWEPHPKQDALDNVFWVGYVGLGLAGMGWAAYAAWIPGLQTAYALNYYALVGSWLVGGLMTLVVGMAVVCWIALYWARWTTALVQSLFLPLFYHSHPRVRQFEQQPISPKAASAYYERQAAFQTQLTQRLQRLEGLNTRWNHLEQTMVQLRTEANRQLQHAYEESYAQRWQYCYAQRHQALEALHTGEPNALTQQLETWLEAGDLGLVQEAYEHTTQQVQHRYEVALTGCQQQIQRLRRDLADHRRALPLLQEQLAAHREQGPAMERVLLPTTSADYGRYLWRPQKHFDRLRRRF